MVQHFIHAIVAMLAIANPIAATPLFAAITDGMSKSQCWHPVGVAMGAQFLLAGFSGFMSSTNIHISPNTHTTPLG